MDEMDNVDAKNYMDNKDDLDIINCIITTYFCIKNK